MHRAARAVRVSYLWGESAVVSTRMRVARAVRVVYLELAEVIRGHQRSLEVIRGHELRALELAEEIVPRIVVECVVEMAVAEPHRDGLRCQIRTTPMCQHATREAISMRATR